MNFFPSLAGCTWRAGRVTVRPMSRVVELESASGDTSARDFGPAPPSSVLVQFGPRVNAPRHAADVRRLADHCRSEQLRHRFAQRMDGLLGQGKSEVRPDPGFVPRVTWFRER